MSTGIRYAWQTYLLDSEPSYAFQPLTHEVIRAKTFRFPRNGKLVINEHSCIHHVARHSPRG